MAVPIIGAHVSVAGGLLNGVLQARHIGADAIQFFGSSPRQWAVRMPRASDVAEFRRAAARAGIRDIFLHAPYLVNLASLDVPLWKKSVALLTATMKISELIGATGVIVHVGSGESGLFREQSLARAAAGLKQVLRQAPGKSLCIIENSAGGGEKVGKDLAEVAWFIKRLGSKRIGVCIDTAHAFEAGIAEYSRAGVERLAEDIERTIGWARLTALHANDSKTAAGSRNDRHENIGKGYIGADGFRNLLAHPKFRAVPFVLEVPGYDGKGPDKKNVDALKQLAAK
jgi:deoxyribonuclease-4